MTYGRKESEYKIVISLLFVLILVLLLGNDAAFADTSGTCGENLTWELDDEGNLTIFGTGTMTDYYLSCGPWGPSIKTVTILEGVTSIGGHAFYNCESLIRVTIPASVTMAGCFKFFPYENSFMTLGPFEGCSGLKTAGPHGGDYNIQLASNIPQNAFVNSCVSSIIVPDGATYVGNFTDCINLTHLTIPNSVASIGSLSGCIGLLTAGPSDGDYNIKIGWTQAIPDYAFNGSCLTSITIPDGITSIGKQAFAACTNLNSITIPDSVITIGEDVFLECTNIRSAGPIDGNYDYRFGWIKSIPNNAFSGCTELNDITIPNSINDIGFDAFKGCLEMRSAGPIGGDYNCKFGWTDVIPSAAFFSCEGLRSVTIPDSVYAIGASAFAYCSNLTNITIPESVTNFGEYVFQECLKLKSAGPIGGDYNYKFGWSKFIPRYAFSYCGLTSVTIPKGITYIGENAFYECTNLTNVVIPDSVTSINRRAFYGCGLTSIIIPDSIISIGEYAFSNCALKSVVIPSSVINIGYNVFSGTNLESAGPIDGDYDYRFGWKDIIPANAFQGCRSLYNITIPDTVTTIDSCAFEHCSGLKSITLPDSVTSIGYAAFESCSLLRSIALSNEVSTIGNCAFFECRSLANITIPKKVTSIGRDVFTCCDSLTAYVYPDSYGFIYVQSQQIPYILVAEFGIPDFVLPKSIDTIENSAFESVAATIVYIPDSCLNIKEHAFYNSKELTQIRIPAECNISDNAFEGCVDLTIFGTKGSAAEIYCSSHSNCSFVPEE